MAIYVMNQIFGEVASHYHFQKYLCYTDTMSKITPNSDRKSYIELYVYPFTSQYFIWAYACTCVEVICTYAKYWTPCVA